jgi:proline iminopeptidase
MKKIVSVILLFLLISCKENFNYFEKPKVRLQNGGVQMIPIKTEIGTFNVWTKRIGNNPTKKLLLLNGGPGLTHEYFECFENFLMEESIEIIYYDQLGCGNSDNPKNAKLWDLPRYVEEVETVRKALGLNKDNFYVLGHSWGGILAMEYALKYQQNLKGLIISNMMADGTAYDKYAADILAKEFEPKLLKEVYAIEAKKDYTNPRYMEILMPNFYQFHICRIPIKNWPEPVNRSFSKINYDLYLTMQGPSEFGLGGKLETWNIMDKISNIKTPTLVIGAKYDTMDPKFMEKMAEVIPNATYHYCPKGSHMCFYDDQENYFAGLLAFIKK